MSRLIVPRLPMVPAAIANAMAKPAAPLPPPPLPPPPLQQASDLEGGQFIFSANAGPYPVDTPVTVYKTKRRWAGIDVYATVQGTSGGTIPYVRVWIYALTGISRVLVGTGWLRVVNGYSARIAVARTIASNFEVVAELCSFGVATPTIALSFVASDECLDVDPSDVASSLTGNYISSSPAVLPILAPGAPTPARFQTQLTGAVVTNTTAAVIYWQALDTLTVPTPAPAVSPIVSVAVPAFSTVTLTSEMLQGYRYGSSGLVCGGSSTPSTFTAVAAGALLQQVWGT